MSTDSRYAGYLQPTGTAPTEDDALTNLFQEAIVALSGLPGAMVRPLWQPEPANLPAISDNWVAVGIIGRKQDAFPFVDQVFIAGDPDDTEHQRQGRQEEFTLLCSFYGPNNDGYCSLIRDGLYVSQNHYELQKVGINLIGLGDRVKLPEYINSRWYQRCDMEIYFRRLVVRNYPILSMTSADITTHHGY